LTSSTTRARRQRDGERREPRSAPSMNTGTRSGSYDLEGAHRRDGAGGRGRPASQQAAGRRQSDDDAGDGPRLIHTGRPWLAFAATTGSTYPLVVRRGWPRGPDAPGPNPFENRMRSSCGSGRGVSRRSARAPAREVGGGRAGASGVTERGLRGMARAPHTVPASGTASRSTPARCVVIGVLSTSC
jgi:hypothetical protein